MDGKKILKRNEINEKDKWDLTAMFESDEAWEKELASLSEYYQKAAEYEGKLSSDGKTLLAFLRFEDSISARMLNLYQYASCKSDEDTADSKYQDFKGKAMSLYVGINGTLAFAVPEIMSIDEDKINTFFTDVKELDEYRRKIYSIRRMKEHILSPECERILAMTGEMGQAPETIGSIFRDADMRYPDVSDSKGEVHPLTDGTLVPLMTSEDRTLRENAFKAYYASMGQFKNTTSAFLDAQFKSLKFYSEARKYSSSLEASLDANEIPVSVYENLIESVHNNLDKMYRYVSLRKRLLGVDELHMYDVYTPIIPNFDREIPFDEAKDIVLDALSVLGDDYVSLLKRAFDERWIDKYENEGKRSGAYSTGPVIPHPYVLLNHKDNIDSLFTLAHELGHAVHSYLSSVNQPESKKDYVIFVAEVASTCNETLLIRYLLNKTDDKRERAYLINHFLDTFKGTIYRQTMFAEFEMIMGKMCEGGETLTADALCGKYHELNKLYFGPEMISDDEIALEWSRIPHFFYNYYVFQYATGLSAAVAIANRILKEGESAVKDYKKFLSGGCSSDPISLLKIAGVDMSTPKPVNDALELFGELLDEIEKLI